jgi:hypothetical protein
MIQVMDADSACSSFTSNDDPLLASICAQSSWTWPSSALGQ